METLKMHSLDGVQRNIELIGKLFPNAITEVKRNGKVEHAIDFDVLRQELSDSIVEGREERYQFTWPDKKKAILAANAPITATLRPVVADSVGKDGTPGGFDSENLYIEGDNLEVLKLLQETYLGKVKMIYIDPPYNTGNDFVYNDEFGMRDEEWNATSGNYDEEGNQIVGRLELNTESNGRFHTDWLNMIYPRLKLAKDLLSDDGVILASIGDKELRNLQAVMDEIYGAANQVCCFVWKSRAKPTNAGSARFKPQKVAEYVLVYSKSDPEKQIYNVIPAKERTYPHEDELGKFRTTTILTSNRGTFRRETMRFESHGYTPSDDFRWKAGKETIDRLYDTNHMYVSEDGVPMEKKYAQEESDPLYPIYTFVDADLSGTAESGKAELGRLVGKQHGFDTVKPVQLIKYLVQTFTNKKDIILDFFSGSATTAQAVIEQNEEDHGTRKYILVQIEEKCDPDGEAFKAGFKTICEIGKERIRRAGKQILSAGGGGQLEMSETQPESGTPVDVGFRCLRLDSSNMENVYYTPEEISQQDMFSLVDNVKPDRTPEDLLFQVMLDLGVLLSSSIAVKEIADKKVFNVAEGFLLACFDHDVTEETVKAIAQMKPYYAVFRDSSMANDSVATNFDQIFETYSPETVRKVL
ncbi:MAG: site-specific DNA-methyltransferase [[Eubacterium] rectale]|nr:site-specific DNA-methyltransferase [Agathobacter rectalis]